MFVYTIFYGGVRVRGRQMLRMFSLDDACLFFETILPSLPTMK